MSGFSVDVRTSIPAGEYKKLHAVAVENNTTVGALVAELVRRQLAPKRHGTARSRYTPEMGERIWEARRFNRSYSEAGAELGVSPQTAQRWLRLYEVDLRTAQLEKKAS